MALHKHGRWNPDPSHLPVQTDQLHLGFHRFGLSRYGNLNGKPAWAAEECPANGPIVVRGRWRLGDSREFFGGELTVDRATCDAAYERCTEGRQLALFCNIAGFVQHQVADVFLDPFPDGRPIDQVGQCLGIPAANRGVELIKRHERIGRVTQTYQSKRCDDWPPSAHHVSPSLCSDGDRFLSLYQLVSKRVTEKHPTNISYRKEALRRV